MVENEQEICEILFCTTSNVRSRDYISQDKGLKYKKPPKYFEFLEKELSDQEVINILLNDILYGEEPYLEGSSLVGSNSNHIDADINYHNGNYLLNNGKEYTMTYCCGTIKIREGRDGGWYPGTNEVGRTLYEGKLDYLRLRDAIIKYQCKEELKIYNFFETHPDVLALLYEKLKTRESCSLKN